jgi:integrase
VHGKRQDAERERDRLLNILDNGLYTEPTNITFAEFMQNWLDSARPNLGAKTWERYNELVECHLLPNLGHLRLKKLQPLHIQNYYTKALTHGRRDGKGGLSARTVLHIHRLLRKALQQGVKWGMLIRNPCDAVEAPKPARPEMIAIDEKDTARLLNAAEGTPHRMPILLAVTTGLRRGELLGLKWEDVDFNNETLAVRRSLQQTRVGGLQFKTPKTGKSRVVSLPKVALAALRKHRAEQAELRLALGKGLDEQTLVFETPDGKPRKPSSLSDSFRYVVSRAGLKLRFHDLRHSHASQLLKSNTHPKIVSERLGHSTVGITLDTYSHILPGLQREAAEKVDAALGAAIDGHKAG